MKTKAALAAAAGSALLAVLYFITNALPILKDLDSVPGSALMQPFGLLIFPQLLWIWFFVTVWRGEDVRRTALVVLVAGVVPQALYSWVLHWPTLSLLSFDSIAFVVGDALPQVAYGFFLVGIYRGAGIRKPAYVLWVLTTLFALSSLFNFVANPPFGKSLWLPIRHAILIFHPLSQSLFFRSQRRA